MHQQEARSVAAVRASVTLATLLVVIVACSSSSVTLGEINYPSTPLIVSRSLSPAIASEPDSVCPGSFRASRGGEVGGNGAHGDIYATWWHVRPDSSSILMAGRSTDDGRTWSTVTPADTLDVSRRGCNRPAPAIFANSATNYVSIAYFSEAREGPGIFYTHSMDARRLGTGDGIFHSPVSVMYGEHPSRVSIAGTGDDIAVAYEDPNAERPTIGLALSHVMGHLFETRVQVSSPDVPAQDPRVALSRGGRSVTVQWAERPDSVESGGRTVVRRGEWR